jgi:hypothetical protein
MRVFILVGLLAACGPSSEAKEICEKAADRWIQCAREMLGDHMAGVAEQKRDVNACARDERTVKMYEKCLAAPDCDAMMDCMMAEVGAEF